MYGILSFKKFFIFINSKVKCNVKVCERKLLLSKKRFVIEYGFKEWLKNSKKNCMIMICFLM